MSKHLWQAGSKWRAPLFLVSKQNLNLSYWCIWHIKNCQKHIRIEKVTAPQVEGVKNSEKTNHQMLQSQFPNTQKIHYMLLLKFKDDL
jgi:hypothetical protein